MRASRGARVGPAAAAAIAWGLLTVAMIAGPVLVYRIGGAAALRGIVQEGPISDLMLTLYAASAAWLILARRVSRRTDDSPFFAAAVERLGSLSARSGAG